MQSRSIKRFVRDVTVNRNKLAQKQKLVALVDFIEVLIKHPNSTHSEINSHLKSNSYVKPSIKALYPMEFIYISGWKTGITAGGHYVSSCPMYRLTDEDTARQLRLELKMKLAELENSYE